MTRWMTMSDELVVFPVLVAAPPTSARLLIRTVGA